MARRAIHPQELARQLHAWEARRQRRAKARRTDHADDEKTAVELLRRATRVLERCVYEKTVRYVDTRRAPLACGDCGEEVDDATFTAALLGKRLSELRCRVCSRRHARK
jgi:hypothetical protein